MMASNFFIFNNGILTEQAMSGCDQRALNWLAYFSNYAKQVSVITSKQGRRRFSQSGNIKILTTAGINLKTACGMFIAYLARAFKGCLVSASLTIDSSQTNVIYSASDLIADFIPAFLLKLRNRKSFFIVGVHLLAPLPWKGFKKHYLKGLSLPSLSGIYYFLSQRFILRLLIKYAGLVLVSNKEDRDKLIKMGFEAQQVLVSYPAVDGDEINSVPAQQECYDACYLGRFHPQKGFSDLLDIWSMVLKQLPQARLAIVGYDVNLEKVKQAAAEQGLRGKVEFLGFKSGAEKIKILKSSKLALVPSYYESFGIVILEAMACKLPVISYDLPVYQGIYAQGLKKVKIGDKPAFASSIVELLKDQTQRDGLAEQAYQQSLRFGWGKSAAEILERIK